MSGINTQRWLVAGIAAGIVIWVLEGAGSFLYMGDMEAALTAHGLSFEMNTKMWILSVAASLITGLVLMFFYAAARPRFGPGPRTAVIVAVGVWFGGYLLSLVGYEMMGLFPRGLLVTWGAVGLIEIIVAGLVGGWLYREV